MLQETENIQVTLFFSLAEHKYLIGVINLKIMTFLLDLYMFATIIAERNEEKLNQELQLQIPRMLRLSEALEISTVIAQ